MRVTTMATTPLPLIHLSNDNNHIMDYVTNASSSSHDVISNITDVTPMAAMQETSVERFLAIFVPILFGITTIVGTCGNLLVIIVVLSNKQMRNTTNILILNLALADLFFIIVCVPFTAVGMIAIGWPFGNVFCKLYNYILNMTCYASVYTLVLMSLDRYLAVVHPIWSINIRTTANALYVTLIMWVVIVAFTTPILFETGTMLTPDGYFCVNTKIIEQEIAEGTSSHGRLFYGCFFFFGYIMPLTLVCVLYGFMLNSLFLRKAPGGTMSVESMRGKKRVTNMVVIVVCIFAICWLPINIRFLVHYFIGYPEASGFYIYQVLATCLAYMNSCVNPILYAFLSENFRKSFRKLLCCNSRFQPMHVGGGGGGDFERTHVANFKMQTRGGSHANNTEDTEVKKSLTQHVDKNGNA